MAFSYTVTVFRRNLQSQFQVGGQGYRWLDKVKLEMHLACIAEAPSRSGTLKASHRSFIRGINQWACVADIVNTADHAEWVHEGVKGRIYPEDAEYLWVPIARGAAWRVHRSSVKGQAANNWMERACSAVAMGHGAVPYG
jgi:hypothetical protein